MRALVFADILVVFFWSDENCSNSGVEGVKSESGRSWKKHRSSILAVAVFTLLSVMLFNFTKLWGRTGRDGFAARRGRTDRKSDIYI